MARSLYRCTATYQGDRCKLVRGHVRDIPEQQFHAGNFTLWDDDGVVHGKVPGAQPQHKRNRVVNRNSREIVAMAQDGLIPVAVSREAVKKDLDNLVKFYGGKNV